MTLIQDTVLVTKRLYCAYWNRRSPFRLPVLLAILSLLSGCAGYYGQLIVGQIALFSAHEPISEILADKNRDPKLRERLGKVLEARDFASAKLDLPDNDSYRQYADVQRPYVVWNVFATDEFSVEPLRHCFPITGCVAYRGYFDEQAARAKAAELKTQHMDTLVAGIDAYSTLGWFSDPLLNTMMRRNDDQLAALIFHELTHQKLYVQGDTAFNESYASFVEHEGQNQWRAQHGLAPLQSDRIKAYRQIVGELLATRERLRTLYASGLPAEVLRTHKQAEFSRLRQTYRHMRDEQWAGHGYFDHWFKQPLNNATLLPFGLYDQWVPAFEVLFHQVKGDWTAFHAAVAKLAELPIEPRTAALNNLLAAAKTSATQSNPANPPK